MMKKKHAILFLIVLLLAGCAPTAINTEMTISQAEYDAVVAERDALRQENEQLKALATSPPEVVENDLTTSNEEGASTESASVENGDSIGSRKNPAKIGQAVNMAIDNYRGEGDATITLLEVIRGEEAWEIAQNENRFNEKPENAELILYKVEVKLNSWSGDDAYHVSYTDFDCFDNSYAELSRESMVIPNELRGDMYDGASTSGYSSALVPIGEQAYARFEDAVWFCLF